MTLLKAENLTIAYGAHVALRNVSMSVNSNEIVTIVGPNGSGKTSLLRALIGAIVPTKGQIKKKDGLAIGYVPQKLHIDPTLPITVKRFMQLPNHKSTFDCEVALDQAGVPNVLKQQMSSLSGGQFQRVLLARALMGKPDVLLLDEATQGMDQPGSAAFYRQIEDVRSKTGCGILMISHELHVVMSASDRVVCLNGHICCQGAPASVASAPEYRALFGTGTGGALALYQHDHDHTHEVAK